MTFVILLIASLTDPAKWLVILVIAIALLKKKIAIWQVIAISTVVGGVASEALLTAMQTTRTFGQGIIIHLLASFILSFVGVWLVKKYFIKRKT